MQRLRTLGDDIISAQISEKLSRLSAGKLSYDEALQEMSAIEQLYERKYGTRTGWDDALKKSVNGIKSNLIDFYAKNGLGISFQPDQEK